MLIAAGSDDDDGRRRLSAGDGVIVCTADRAGRASLLRVAFSYPLKVITPNRTFLDHVQVAWLISYGGGLVGGDRVRLEVAIDKPSTLVLLTQGSTKVFKARTADKGYDGHTTTLQRYRASVCPGGFLVLLPAPVTCFARAQYRQHQAVHLADRSASLVLLDWYTSGRMDYAAGPEAWQFDEYVSDNEVWIGDTRVVKDVLSLRRNRDEGGFQQRVEPYSAYATLFLFGPATDELRRSICEMFQRVTQYHQPRPYSLVWSYSALDGGGAGGGGVARCAADSTEAVKEWVSELLERGGIEDLIGRDLYKTAL
ncbi:hypothetical protein JCM11491_001989 [Sporobolomyces phaffii]